MARNSITIDGSGANTKTITVYEYDSGQPNNRGSLLGTMSLVAGSSSDRATYRYDLNKHQRVVLVDSGTNIEAFEGVYWCGNEPRDDEYNFSHISGMEAF